MNPARVLQLALLALAGMQYARGQDINCEPGDPSCTTFTLTGLESGMSGFGMDGQLKEDVTRAKKAASSALGARKLRLGSRAAALAVRRMTLGDCDNCINAMCADEGTSTDGLFECTCFAGYVPLVFERFGGGTSNTECVGICTSRPTICGPAAECVQMAIGFDCTCNSGYTQAPGAMASLGSGSSVCIDIDECKGQDDSRPCSPDAACTNLPGSYKCECNEGFSGDGFTCTGIDPSAEPLFVGEPLDTAKEQCSLSASPSGCHADAQCLAIGPTDSPNVCVCNPGYSGDGTTTCVDINECSEGISGCSANANCTNTIGSYVCECAKGFAGDGVTCTNDATAQWVVAEEQCNVGSAQCDEDARCLREPNSAAAACTCNRGFTGDGFSCTDVNECALGTHNCGSAFCVNTNGSFACTCRGGFVFSGGACVVALTRSPSQISSPLPSPAGTTGNIQNTILDPNTAGGGSQTVDDSPTAEPDASPSPDTRRRNRNRSPVP